MTNPDKKNNPGFEPQKMVGWFDLSQLAQTGVKALISSIFGTFADKREALGTMNPAREHNYSSKGELWVDYLSDTGDGFDATYTMAYCLSQDQLAVKGYELPKSKILILGGDQVYPTASRDEYQNRFVGPFSHAFPEPSKKEEEEEEEKEEEKKEKHEKQDHIFAIPGNHDWYDGLNNFAKLFLQDRGIGNWRTRQNRSYFAIKISENTWLWAIDIQLEADIDHPQIKFFEKDVCSKMKKGDRVILCTAEPSWVYSTSQPNDTSYHNLKTFEKWFIEKKKYKLILSLSGDLHHYSHYSGVANVNNEIYESHKITAGGGGAFLHPTHNLPSQLESLREGGNFKLQKTFPSKEESKKMLKGNFFFLFNNPTFGLFLAVIYLLFDWILNIFSLFTSDGLINQLKFIGFSDGITALKLFLISVSHCPPAVVILAILIFGFTMFTDVSTRKTKYIRLLGFCHGMLHALWMCGSLWLFSYFSNLLLSKIFKFDGWIWFPSLVCVEVLFLGSLGAGIIVGMYLIVANRLFLIHNDEAFSSMKIENWKNFLRMHFTKDMLTIYPIGVKKILRWKWNPESKKFESESDPVPELIEDPIIISLK